MYESILLITDEAQDPEALAQRAADLKEVIELLRSGDERVIQVELYVDAVGRDALGARREVASVFERNGAPQVFNNSGTTHSVLPDVNAVAALS